MKPIEIESEKKIEEYKELICPRNRSDHILIFNLTLIIKKTPNNK